MSKRGAGDVGGDERYGAYGGALQDMDADKPKMATAAQMARRKIAAGRKPAGAAARSRGASPALGLANDQSQAQGSGFFGNNQQSSFAPPSGAFTFGSNTPSPAPSFTGFGQSAPAPSGQPQQNGTTNMFGQSAAPSFNSTFNSIATPPPQQNGFGTGTSSMFSTQPSTQQTNSTSFNFGSTQQNGVTPATETNSTFGSFGKAQESTQNGTSNMFGVGGTQSDAPKNPFAGFSFGAQQEKEASKANTPFGGFGASQQHEKQDKSNGLFSGAFGQKPQEQQEKAATPTFGSFGQKQQENGEKSSNIFSGFGQKPQENGEKASSPFPGFGQSQAQSNDKTSTSFGTTFGQQPAADQPLFPSTNGDKEKDSVSQVSASNLFSQAQRNGIKPSENEPPKPLFNFGGGSSTTTSQPDQASSTPTTTGLFGAKPLSQAPQSNSPAKGLFGAGTTFEAPKAGGSVFDSVPKNPSNLKFNFSSSIPGQVYDASKDKDDEDTESASASDKNLFGSTTFGAGKQNPPSLLKAGASQQDTSMTTPESTPQKNSFTALSQQQTSDTPVAPRSMFDRIEKPAETLKAQSSSAPETADAPAAPRSMFDRIERPAETSKAHSGGAPETPASSTPLFAPSTTLAAPSLFQSTQPTSTSNVTKAVTPEALSGRPQKPATQQLFTPAVSNAPASVFNAPATAPPARTMPAPWQPTTTAVSSQLSDVSEVQKGRFRQLNNSILVHLQSQDTRKDWTAIFDYYADAAANIRGTTPPAPKAGLASQALSNQLAISSAFSTQAESTPAPAASTGNIFHQAAKSASSSALASPAAAGNPFATRVSNAPSAVKKRPFEEDNDEPSQPPVTEKRVKPNEPVNYPKLPENSSSTSKLFASALDTSKTSAPASGFNPSTKSLFSASTTTDAAKPSSGFTPSFTAPPAGSGSFLSAFGSKAKAAEDEARKKRMEEDYDSDEETKEQWEKRDREQQEAKRKQFEEAAKSGKGFSFAPATPNKSADATAGEKAQGAGNNTWKPETPVKFSTSTVGTTSTTPAVPPSLGGGNLFGTSSSLKPGTSATTDITKLAPPSAGWNFAPKVSSLSASRATTPGVTTDGETSNAADGEDKEEGGPGEETSEPQIEELGALLPEEREANDIVLELPHIITKTYEKTDDSEKEKWITRGEGKAYILKDKATGRYRILQKAGLSTLALNFQPVKATKYELHPKKDTIVTGTFFDHIHSKPGKFKRFFLTADSADEAKDLVRVLTQGIPGN